MTWGRRQSALGVLYSASSYKRDNTRRRVISGRHVLHFPLIYGARSSPVSIDADDDGDNDDNDVSATFVPRVTSCKYDLSKSDFTSAKNSASIGANIDKTVDYGSGRLLNITRAVTSLLSRTFLRPFRVQDRR